MYCFFYLINLPASNVELVHVYGDMFIKPGVRPVRLKNKCITICVSILVSSAAAPLPTYRSELAMPSSFFAGLVTYHNSIMIHNLLCQKISSVLHCSFVRAFSGQYIIQMKPEAARPVQ